ncbi:hypothetical protein J4729_03055 [Leisingera sp. HS039]|uniref:hypothetical protein n=1 Tax=unclassified Leisingera TaxID=2614906 RepID=UPI0010708F14|nr:MULTISPECIES: hypothetical protein [unclassified Leisingera]MBQ4823534.1 hypothetical protein [Leisingera sp. HS039]QBR37158.1 hypothetical protein ETW23_14465 [Leisingera sp. NJS201]
MPLEAIFGLQLIFSIVVVSVIARVYIAPWLSGFAHHAALAILVLPHTIRHIGMSFQVPGLVGDALPSDFAAAAAYGDLASAVFALLAFLLLRSGASVAIGFAWIFNLFGFIDLVNALRQAEAIPQLGVTWFIPTFIVPVLLVTHVMIFARLIRGAPTTQPGSTAQTG